MIVGSLLLILVAVGLLVAGVLGGSSVLIIASIVTTVIAAVVLILGVRQSASDEEEFDDGEPSAKAAGRGVGDTRAFEQRSSRNVSRASQSGVENSDLSAPVERVATAVDSRGSVVTTIPTQSRERDDIDAEIASTGGVGLAGAPAEASADQTQSDGQTQEPAPDEVDDDPPGEPSAQASTPADAAQVALLMTDVFVVDGRPRYHVARCDHLFGRESEPLPVSEAVELGFSPCSLCEPDTVLLADSRQP